MNTKIADDYSYIKARMEEIKAERTKAPEYEPVEPKETQAQTYMGWDIYPPYNSTEA